MHYFLCHMGCQPSSESERQRRREELSGWEARKDLWGRGQKDRRWQHDNNRIISVRARWGVNQIPALGQAPLYGFALLTSQDNPRRTRRLGEVNSFIHDPQPLSGWVRMQTQAARLCWQVRSLPPIPCSLAKPLGLRTLELVQDRDGQGTCGHLSRTWGHQKDWQSCLRPLAPVRCPPPSSVLPPLPGVYWG